MCAKPIHQDAEGWWFWDETWTERQGPFKTEGMAQIGLELYGLMLYDGPTPEAAEAYKKLLGAS